MRKLAGVDLPGTDPELTAHHAVAEVEGMQDVAQGRAGQGTGDLAGAP